MEHNNMTMTLSRDFYGVIFDSNLLEAINLSQKLLMNERRGLSSHPRIAL